MSLSISLPPDLERLLRDAWGKDLDRAALEALALEGYRSSYFGVATLGRLLGHQSRWDTERLLAERGAYLNYTIDELESDRRTLERLFGQTG